MNLKVVSFVFFFCFYTLKDVSVYALGDFTMDLKLCLAPVPLSLNPISKNENYNANYFDTLGEIQETSVCNIIQCCS